MEKRTPNSYLPVDALASELPELPEVSDEAEEEAEVSNTERPVGDELEEEGPPAPEAQLMPPSTETLVSRSTVIPPAFSIWRKIKRVRTVRDERNTSR